MPFSGNNKGSFFSLFFNILHTNLRVGAVLLAACLFTTDLNADFGASASIPTDTDNWNLVYDGYGQTDFDPTEGILLSPQTATTNQETHAALALARMSEKKPLRNFRLTIEVTNEQQLRTPTPNAWEVFWVMFNYNGASDGSKTSNYLILKPNGLELGTAAGSVDQIFLATYDTPRAIIGQRYKLEMIKRDQSLKVYINGTLEMDYQGSAAPNVLFDDPGAIGLYTEDARVRVHSVTIEPL